MEVLQDGLDLGLLTLGESEPDGEEFHLGFKGGDAVSVGDRGGEPIGGQNRMYKGLAESGQLQDFYDMAQDAFRRGIARRLRESGRVARLSRNEPAARGTLLAGRLLAPLRWSIDRGARESPQAMDAMFHRMVWEEVE